MGFDIYGSFDHINRATTMGIAMVFQLILAARADEMTGAIIRATTAGRMPRKILLSVSLLLIMSGVRNIAIVSIIKNEGRIVPNAAHSAPLRPRILSPTATAIFTANIPGIDCDTANKSRNSSLLTQRFLSTISFSIIEIIAHPPPKVNAPIFKKTTKRSNNIFFIPKSENQCKISEFNFINNKRGQLYLLSPQNPYFFTNFVAKLLTLQFSRMKHLSQIIIVSFASVLTFSSCSLYNSLFNRNTGNSTLISKGNAQESTKQAVTVEDEPQKVATSATSTSTTKKTTENKTQKKKETQSVTTSSKTTAIPSEIINGEWIVYSAKDKVTSGDDRPYVIFDEASKTMYANNGCNTLNAEYKISNEINIEFINLLSTQRYCHDAQFELEINEAFANVKSISVKDSGNEYYMTFLNLKNEPLMVLRKSNLDFINGTWKITKVNSTQCKNKDIELALDLDELKVHGRVGCNIVNGSMLLDASKPNSITFLDLITTMASCPDMALETEILMALEKTEYYKKGKDNKTLTFFDKNDIAILELASTSDKYSQE